jgi:hypothetical protein
MQIFKRHYVHLGLSTKLFLIPFFKFLFSKFIKQHHAEFGAKTPGAASSTSQAPH